MKRRGTLNYMAEENIGKLIDGLAMLQIVKQLRAGSGHHLIGGMMLAIVLEVLRFSEMANGHQDGILKTERMIPELGRCFAQKRKIQ